MSLKILQLSDLHIGDWRSVFLNEKKNMEQLCDIIVKKWDKTKDKPLIIVTGDVTDSGTKRQYRNAKSIFEKLRQHGFSLYLVPGNHDYGVIGNLMQKKRFRRFQKYLFGIEGISYPSFKLIKQPNFDLVLIGLDTLQSETSNSDRLFADGEIGSDQLDEIDDKLDYLESLEVYEDKKYVKIVYLHHHPFILPEDLDEAIKKKFEQWFHMLKDGADLMDRISNNRVDALLFGHDHDHVRFDKKYLGAPPLTKKYGINTILSCGKTTKKKNGKFPVWLLNIDDEGKITVEKDSLA